MSDHFCVCVFPTFHHPRPLSDKTSENQKAKNNIRKARLALWWKAVMTMGDGERTERRRRKEGGMKEAKVIQTDRQYQQHFTAGRLWPESPCRREWNFQPCPQRGWNQSREQNSLPWCSSLLWKQRHEWKRKAVAKQHGFRFRSPLNLHSKRHPA